MSEDFDGLRRRLQASLPSRVEAALAGYERFSAKQPPADAKGFGAWHGAAKSALAHVELLVKMARWAEGGADIAAPDPAAGLDRLLAEARAALDEFDEESGGDDT